ncbi:leucine-rich repeat protein [Butyrivibrio sp. NC2002]|uniref:leucine-rich repeat protein n=1 Tax=Butyrivibrio sp. NC2002 TaxID=1410610 RepID=UPI0005635336|nr:leucine-rich repeat protein [Butyrivibrio sp. NC2002]
MRKDLLKKVIAGSLIAAMALVLSLVPIRGSAHSKEPAESFSLYKDGSKEFVLDVDACAEVQRAPIGISSGFSYDEAHDALKIVNIKVTKRDMMVYLDKVSAIYVSGECKIPVIRTDCLSKDFYGNDPYCSTVTVYMDPGSSLEVGDMYDYNYNDVDSKIACGPGVKMKAARDGKAMKFKFTAGGLKIGKSATVKGVKYKIVSTDAGVGAQIIKGKTTSKVKIGAEIKIKGYSYAITSIAKNAYKGKKNIKEVKLGDNISQVGASAFAGCKKLKKITINARSLKSVGKNAFKGISKNAVFVLVGTGEEKAAAAALIKNGSTGFKDTMTVE